MPALTDINFDVTAATQGRADLAVQKFTGLPRRRLRGLFSQGCVRINGKPCTATYARVEPGDHLLVRFDPGQHYTEPPKAWKDPSFSVVFEDEHLIVVNKTAGFLSVPAGDQPADTLVDRVTKYLGKGGRGRQSGGKSGTAYVVHRLDREVSGLLVFAKTPRIQKQIRDQFEARKPHRQYIAIVRGMMPQREGTFRSHLATGEDLSRYSTRRTDKGELAITHFKLERKLDDASLVRVWLETGRRNQIRVHFAEAEHPVLGDTRYRPQEARHPRWRTRRLALHAAILGFDHPVTGKTLTFEEPPPSPFVRFIEGAMAARRGRERR